MLYTLYCIAWLTWVVYFVLYCVVDVCYVLMYFVLCCVVCLVWLTCGLSVTVLALKVTVSMSGCLQSLVRLAQSMRVASFSWTYTSQVTTPSNHLRSVHPYTNSVVELTFFQALNNVSVMFLLMCDK